MKSSRAMLLAAMLFVAPVFADEAGQVQDTNTEVLNQSAPLVNPTEDKKEVNPTEDKKEVKTETPSWFSAKLGLITTAAAAVANWPVENLTTPVLSRVPYLKNNETFKRNIPTMGRVILASALIAAAVKAYDAYNNAQDDSNDDEDIFGE